jgi:phage-related protein
LFAYSFFVIRMWTVHLTPTAAQELGNLGEEQRAHFMRIRSLIQDHGLERVRHPHVDHIEGELWEMRLKGPSGIARALYITRRQQRVVVVRVFVKKTQKTPRREIQLARSRAAEVA